MTDGPAPEQTATTVPPVSGERPCRITVERIALIAMWPGSSTVLARGTVADLPCWSSWAGGERAACIGALLEAEYSDGRRVRLGGIDQ